MEYCCETFEKYHFDLFYLQGDEVETNVIIEDNCIEHTNFAETGLIHSDFVKIRFCPFCGADLLKLVNEAPLALTNHTT